MLENISKQKWIILCILFFIFLSIFFRTYHFHDWLSFNPDQARDARIVSDVLSEKTSLPLLGSIAGGTHFHLGPIFYYFGIFCAFIFGDHPDSLAYVDLFFSLLTLPLFFLFLRYYFETRIALLLSILIGISPFFISISRFSWNPNSIPFFTTLFLYALLRIMNEENKGKYTWPIIVGISFGIGIQLHTFLLLIMPTVVFFFLLYQYIKKKKIVRTAVFIFLSAFVMNSPQIVSEIQTNWKNTRTFFSESAVQTQSKLEIGKNIVTVLSCHIQTNANMIFSIENIDGCIDVFSFQKSIKKYIDAPGVIDHLPILYLAFFVSILFSLFGYILLFRSFIQEKDVMQKNFLFLIILYISISLLFFFPVASHIEPRYFSVLFFVPFTLLGLLLQFFLVRIQKNTSFLFWFFIAIIIALNLCVVWNIATPYRNKVASDTENSVLGEIEPIAEYIEQHTNTSETFITGGKIYMKRFFDPLEYLLYQKGILLKEYNESEVLKDGQHIFYIIPASSTKKLVQDTFFSDRTILEQKQFGKISLFFIE